MSTVTSRGGRTEISLDFDQSTLYDNGQSYKGVGWVLFATIMLVMGGILNIIWGIAAVSNSHFFAAGASYILINSLNAWGWIVMAFGVLEGLAALSIWRGGEFGRWFGIIVAGFAGIVAMMSIPAYPFWSLALLAIAVLVIYGLAAYGGKPYLTR
jgi:hypothetical protein